MVKHSEQFYDFIYFALVVTDLNSYDYFYVLFMCLDLDRTCLYFVSNGDNMTEPQTTSNSFSTIHKISIGLLFLMMAQPTFDNIKALATGSMVMGDVTIEVTLSKMVLHLVAMIVGWIGLWWFIQRKKLGAYTSISAHAIGFTAVMTQTPEMLKTLPPAAIAVFFIVLFIVALGPVFKFKEEFS